MAIETEGVTGANIDRRPPPPLAWIMPVPTNAERHKAAVKFDTTYKATTVLLNAASYPLLVLAPVNKVREIIYAADAQHSVIGSGSAALLIGFFATLAFAALSTGKNEARPDKPSEFRMKLADEKLQDLIEHPRLEGLWHAALRSNFTRVVTYPVILASFCGEALYRKTANAIWNMIDGEEMLEGLPVTNKIRKQLALWNLIDPLDYRGNAYDGPKPGYMLGDLDGIALRRAAKRDRKPAALTA